MKRSRCRGSADDVVVQVIVQVQRFCRGSVDIMLSFSSAGAELVKRCRCKKGSEVV